LIPDAPRAQAVRPWDELFRALPQPSNIQATVQRLSARPHHVGSPYDKENAEWSLARFKEWGWDATIEQFDVLFPTPKERHLELVEPTRFVAALEEPVVAADPTTNQKTEQLPSYNAYSIDGDVTAPLVYVNYGRPEDYEQLDRLGLSVRGAIVIARYGASWRGIKPKVAAEHGAVGCLIYSDPRDDGYAQGLVFPAGPMRPSTGVQRGSVMDMPLYPGDPLTPGVGATATAQRLEVKDAATITKIPVLPISYADAQPLLAALSGPTAPDAFRGALPITYRLGPGAAKVHLKVAFNWDRKTLYDVIAKIPGSAYPDEWIIRGNHHDAWGNGAADPASGIGPELEEARVLGELRKQGWAPKRTIVYAAWDGEEPALLGSTEWVETHMDDLQRHAVAYINSDGNGRGFLNAGGSHSLENFVNDVARDVKDPETGLSVWKRRQARAIVTATAAAREQARNRADVRISALGSGSDYTPFLQHAGIASLSIGYGDEDDDGIYHSIYDDFYFYTHFLDTDFAYGRTLAQTIGTAVIRLADADVQGAIDSLKHRSLVVETSGGRVMRYAHNVERALAIPAQSAALVAVLLLRGPQTAGELRINTDRMHRFADISAVEAFLNELAARPAGALVAEIPRAPGTRETRWTELLTKSAAAAAHAATSPTAGADDAHDDVAALARELAMLRDEVTTLRATVERLLADRADASSRPGDGA